MQCILPNIIKYFYFINKTTLRGFIPFLEVQILPFSKVFKEYQLRIHALLDAQVGALL